MDDNHYEGIEHAFCDMAMLVVMKARIGLLNDDPIEYAVNIREIQTVFAQI